jgi:hypothetical protein
MYQGWCVQGQCQQVDLRRLLAAPAKKCFEAITDDVDGGGCEGSAKAHGVADGCLWVNWTGK